MSAGTGAAPRMGAPGLDYVRLFDQLSGQVKAAGLMAPRPGFYVAWMAGNGMMLAAGWVAFGVAGDTWWQLAVALYLAFWYGQTGLVGHDTGHRQVFRTRAATEVAGFLHGNLLTGVSYGWWVNHHNRHHSHPNHLERDPDILRRQVIFSTSQLATRTGAAARLIIRHQSWLFFLLILLEGFRLHLAGYLAAARGAIRRNRALDIGVLTGHLLGYGAAVCWVLSPVRAVVFVLLHQMVFGLYMGLLFAPNHKGLPVRGGAEEELDWARRQIVTSRNLVSNRLVDYLYGGLNYQIEHHLFPTMPSVNLRRARPLVREFCARHDLPYVEVTVGQSYRMVSEYLGEVSQQSSRLIARGATGPGTGRAG
ncbi:MAG: acyl-CoA desaturase [Actinobacteria bacterium]|nr:acyl-CoA desaturase [Actinomycetota bacterium]MBI3688545.1 acyl-CoA desaturase [Actinomycetota bacterium]